jgi:aspartyl-tRNA(Asn)/glutamyl-tRNA(Gln) amidotransferase subunit B
MFKPAIGLEIHIELNTRSKMFCGCRNNPDEKRPNVNICPICAGQPGTLPAANKEAIKKVIKTGLALGCEIAESSKFDRKNYFYPDLPKGYQISQYDRPFCQKGFLEIGGRKIRITRIHLEEDTAKLIHPEGKGYSLVDFNRAGVPLMEMVTEPDLTSGKEARRFSQELQLILRYLNVSKADMEKGQLRVEVNVSLSRDKNFGTKVEIKNLNSFRAVEKAIDYEIERQKEILKKGEKVVQETRGWNDAKEATISQRKKEEAHDYRYFPEPDLPVIHLTDDLIEKIKMEIPELPEARRKRFKREYQLNEKDIEVFVSNKDLGEYFEKAASELRQWVKEMELKEKVGEKEFLKLVKICSNYLISDLQGLLKGSLFVEKDFSITPENFGELVALIYEGKISSKMAKILLEEMLKTGADPSRIIEEKELVQITDEGEIEKIAEKVISENKKAVSDYKKGKKNAFQFLVGKIMGESQGRAKPSVIAKILEQTLDKIK